MVDISLTRKACASLYSSSTSLIIAVKCYRQIAAALQPGITIFVIEPDGIIRCRGEKKYDADDTISVPGAPAGLLGIVSCKQQQQEILALTALLELHSIETVPPILTLASAPTFWRRYKYRKFINGLLFDRLLYEQKKLAVSNRQLVQQRQEGELLQMRLKKARNMITGIGYDYHYATVDVPAGLQTIGPGGTIHTHDYTQILPVACAGINCLSLYIVSLPEQLNIARLKVTVVRKADNKVLMKHLVSASNLQVGWNGFVIGGEDLVSIADAELHLSWEEAEGLLLALSDSEADRFGDDNSQTLALRVYQNLLDPSTFDDAFKTSDASHTREVTPLLQMSGRKLPDMSDNFSFYRGYEAHQKLEQKHGFPIVTLNGETRVLQLHPVIDGLAAAVYKSAVPTGAMRIACEVGTAHYQAPVFTYIMIALPTGVNLNIGEYVEDICSRVQKGESEGADKLVGSLWNSVQVCAAEKRLLEIDFPNETSSSMDTIFAVVPVDGDMSFGWCRWYRFFVTTKSRNHWISEDVEK